MQRLRNLSEALATAWDLPAQSLQTKDHPMRTPAIATVAEGRPSVRKVVLRGVQREHGQLLLFTDARAAKVGHLSANPYLSWLFWDPEAQVQIRASGPAHGLSYPDARPYWDAQPLEARRNYAASAPPGTPRPVDGDGLATGWPERQLADSEVYFQHFLVLVTRVEDIDLLHLHPDGHQRAQFRRKPDAPGWAGSWVTP